MSSVEMERAEETVCLSCVKMFDVKANNKRKVYDSDQYRQLYRRFHHFAKEHLKLAPGALEALSIAWAASVGGDKAPVFCGECENGLIVICNLYEGLCKVKSELAGKVGQWAEKLEVMGGEGKGASAQSGEEEWDHFVLEELAGRMKLKGGTEAVKGIRKQMAESCKQKAIVNVKLPPPAHNKPLPKLVPAPPQMKTIIVGSRPGPASRKLKTVQQKQTGSSSTDDRQRRSSGNQSKETSATSTECSIQRTGSGRLIIQRKSVDKPGGSDIITTALSKDIDVSEVDEPNSNAASPAPSTSIDDDESVKVEDPDIKQEEEDDGWYGMEDDPLGAADNANFRANQHSPSSSIQSFSIKPTETITVTPKGKVDMSFFDESDNMEYRQGEAVRRTLSQDGLVLPLDVSIEEVLDESFSGQSSSPNSPRPHNNIHIVGVNKGGSDDSPQKKRRKITPQGPSTTAGLDTGDVPEDIPGFVDFFKRRRKELGLTQSDVARSLGAMFGTDEELFSQTTVSRFEAMNLSEKNMEKLRPLFQKWLEMADPQTLVADLTSTPQVSRRRKRTTIDKEMLDSLEEYFQQNSNPTSNEIHELAQQLNLEKEVVRVWFCNRRQREKKATGGPSRPHSSNFLGEGQPASSPNVTVFQTSAVQSQQPQYVVIPTTTAVQQTGNLILLQVNPFINTNGTMK